MEIKKLGIGETEKIELSKTCLVVIDMNYFCAHRDHGLGKWMQENEINTNYYFKRVEKIVTPNTQKLLKEFRNSGIKIAFVEVGAHFDDFSDTLIHLRKHQMQADTKRCKKPFRTIDELEPLEGEILVSKPGSSAMTTSGLDIRLRNAGIKNLIITGVVTNFCVMLTSLSAYDLGYYVYVVEDACATSDQHMHDIALELMNWMGIKVISTEEAISIIN